MKPPSIDDVLCGTLPASLGNYGSDSPHPSLFSLLLEIESRLRAETRRDSRLQARKRKPGQGQNYRRPRVENLSRYIE